MAEERQADRQGGSTPEFLRSPRFWIAVVIAALVVSFIAQNRDPVSSSVLVFSFTAPQWVTLSIVFVAGIIAGLLLGRRRRRR